MDERLVRGVAAALADHADDDGEPCWSASLLEQARREIRRRLRGGGAADDATKDDDDDAERRILERAQERAVQIMMHKEKSVAASAAAASGIRSSSVASTTSTTQQKQPTSFSLFAAGAGMSLLTTASMVTWDGICEQAETTQERLALLQKVEFIDDILPDWETHVRPFLQNALHEYEDGDADSAVCLHRKWFHRTRGSHAPEYQAFQLDLLENLVHAVKDAAAAFQNNQAATTTALFTLTGDDDDDGTFFWKPAITTSLDMFADLVDRDSVKDYQRRNAIGKLLWTSWIPSSQILKIMVQHDTLAVGFSKWILGYLNAADTVSLLLLTDNNDEASTNNTTLLEQLFRWATRSTEAFAVPTTTTTDLQQRRIGDVLLHLPVACFTLSILRSALVVTRVSTFPWASLLGPQSQHDNDDNNEGSTSTQVAPPQSMIGKLAQCYCRLIHAMLVVLPNNDSDENTAAASLHEPERMVMICADALDTILCGCRACPRLAGEAAALKEEIQALTAAVVNNDKIKQHPRTTSTLELLQRMLQ